MELLYPAYYKKFSCLAGACSDSCCKEWEVDVDDSSAAFYRALPGPLGDRLREVLRDTEYGTVLTIQQGRCPMWQQDGLCRIHAELGHDALCKTCREFPRLRHDYGTFTELGLELSCPEAARLILSSPYQETITQTVSGDEPPEYDTQMMKILLRTRKEFLSFLETTHLDFPQILRVLLLYGHEVQAELDGESPAMLLPDEFLRVGELHAQPADPAALAAFFQTLEILTPQWDARLHAPLECPVWTPAYRALLRYFLNRYYLQAVADGDILCRIKFAVTACLLIGYLGGNLTETAQLFSKEIENDPDNVEAILDGSYTSPALTDLLLLSLCHSM